jgi:hypothetical protein
MFFFRKHELLRDANQQLLRAERSDSEEYLLIQAHLVAVVHVVEGTTDARVLRELKLQDVLLFASRLFCKQIRGRVDCFGDQCSLLFTEFLGFCHLGGRRLRRSQRQTLDPGSADVFKEDINPPSGAIRCRVQKRQHHLSLEDGLTVRLDKNHEIDRCLHCCPQNGDSLDEQLLARRY